MMVDAELRTVSVGDTAFFRGDRDSDLGVVKRVYGPHVDVQWDWRDTSGIDRTEYYRFPVHGLDWDEALRAWQIKPETMMR